MESSRVTNTRTRARAHTHTPNAHSHTHGCSHAYRFGEDANMQTSDGTSLLGAACRSSSPEASRCVALLLAHGAIPPLSLSLPSLCLRSTSAPPLHSIILSTQELTSTSPRALASCAPRQTTRGDSRSRHRRTNAHKQAALVKAVVKAVVKRPAGSGGCWKR